MQETQPEDKTDVGQHGKAEISDINELLHENDNEALQHVIADITEVRPRMDEEGQSEI